MLPCEFCAEEYPAFQLHSHQVRFYIITYQISRISSVIMSISSSVTSSDNDNDNELFIQTKSNEKHHKGNINNT